MNVGERVKYAEQMVKEYLGEDHKLYLKNTRRMLGQMDYREKKITLSYKLVARSSDEFFDSVLFHEIAHGLSHDSYLRYYRAGMKVDFHQCIEFKRWCAYFGSHSARAIRFNS